MSRPWMISRPLVPGVCGYCGKQTERKAQTWTKSERLTGRRACRECEMLARLFRKEKDDFLAFLFAMEEIR